MNDNEDINNHSFLWQGEWNHLLMFALCRIVFCFKRQSLLHVLSSSKHVAPNLYESNWQWRCLPRFENHLWWWQYPLISTYDRRKAEKSLSIHELHSPTWQLVMEIPSDGDTQHVPQYIKNSCGFFCHFLKSHNQAEWRGPIGSTRLEQLPRPIIHKTILQNLPNHYAISFQNMRESLSNRESWGLGFLCDIVSKRCD